MSVDKTFKYGELEGTFSVSDSATAERWETAIAEYGKTVEDMSGIEKESARIKHVLAAVATFIDAFLGEGSALAAYGETTDLEVALDAMSALIEFVTAQSAALAAKYSVGPVSAKK